MTEESRDRFRNFDSFVAEEERRPIRFRAAGVDIELPPDMPAKVALLIMRANAARRGEGDLGDQETLDIAEAMLGAENLERLLSAGISFAKLSEILQWVSAEYSGQATPDDAEATGARGNRKGPASSSAGPS